MEHSCTGTASTSAVYRKHILKIRGNRFSRETKKERRKMGIFILVRINCNPSEGQKFKEEAEYIKVKA